MTTNSWQQGVKDCVPTLVGYISIGLAFGVVGIASNLSVIEIFLLAVLVYAGSAQFIFCGLYMAGAPAMAIILTVFIVNLRHLLMAFTIAPYFQQYSLAKNIRIGTLLTDETFSVAALVGGKEGRLGGRWMSGLNVTAYVAWIAACTTGGLLGQFIPSAEAWGLDYALVAMFIALVVLSFEALHRSYAIHMLKMVGVVGIVVYICLHWMPGHIAVLVATMVAATIGVLTEK